MTNKELELRKKHELDQNLEQIDSTKVFVPEVDIYDNKETLVIKANMPGVKKEDVQINIKENILYIHGQIAKQDYESLKPIYGEYNIGHYKRTFELGSMIDQNKIEAKMEDGVLYLTLAKAEQAKPRQITIS